MHHRNRGVWKRCLCKRKDWPKCAHPWQFNFTPRGGKNWRFSLDAELGQHIASRTEAEKIASEIRAAINAGTFERAVDRRRAAAGAMADAALPLVAADTVESYTRRDWLPTAGLNLKAMTVRFYTDHLENHVFPLLGSRPLAAVTRRDCRELITACRAKDLKIGTVRGIVRTLSTVLSQAVDDELLSANPALNLRKYLRTGDESEPPMDPFSRAEALHLVQTARDQFPAWHAWVLCGLRTGLRPSELLGLQWGDIDWRGRFIQVQRSIVRGVLTTTKNHQCRRVDVSPDLRVRPSALAPSGERGVAEA